tara:strand:- start:2962 stop:3471 length:510 start_codon:yes stop_codon:yes gene_type:complete
MQTVYILKDSNKSYRALLQLYKTAELSTNIIIVNKFYAKILLLDKRVKTFPFIINTLPTNIGLVPKFAKVLPLELFLKIRRSKKNKPFKENKHKSLKVPSYEKPPRSLYTNFVIPKNLRANSITPSVNSSKFHKHSNLLKHVSKHYNKVRKPLIKTVKESDGSVNIIMK